MVTRDILHTISTVSNCAAGKSHISCEYCGSAEDQSSVWTKAEVCPMCKTKSHSLMYICPLLKEVKNQEKEYRGYRYDGPSSKPSEKVCQVKGQVRDVQTTSIVGMSTPVLSLMGYVYQQNVCFDDDFR